MQSLKLASYPLYSGITKDVKRAHANINECDLHAMCNVEGNQYSTSFDTRQATNSKVEIKSTESLVSP